MRVERLELVGFKSFADKTVFKFHPGTTAIVGPNGCGKSNIVDAFKWVLGEQSAKSLRGGKMEDVIFAGSATKKTKGMAEVTLVLSDIVRHSNGTGDDENQNLTNVSVTRRLYRSGESEYLMNKVPCRLKDIRNLFLDTGLELKAYSILEQGRIGDIVNSKPQDRRFLIEEVAGVMKYKIRKNEAMSKLESSKRNMQRLQDIIAEVKRQINTIDRHARKAERYKKLFEEIKDIEIRISKRNLLAFQEEITALAASEESLSARNAEVTAKVHSTEALIEEKKRLCVEHERSLQEIRMRLYALERENTEDEGKIALLKSDCENLRERYNLLIRQDKDLTIEKATATDLVKEIEEVGAEMQKELENLERLLAEKDALFAEVDGEISGFEHTLEEQRRNLFSKAEEISGIRNEISHIDLNIQNIRRKTERSSQDMSSLNEDMSNLKTALQRAEEEHEQFGVKLRETKAEKEGLAARLNENRQKLSSNEASLYSEREDLAALSSRLESLKEIDRSSSTSLDDSIKSLCRVADIFETPAEYETAIEAVLGDKLGASVVEDRNEITRALQLIKENKTKRSGFIVAAPSGNNASVRKDSYLARGGIIGEASRFVSVKEGYEGIARSLLNDVYLVDSLDTAFSLWRESASSGGGHVYFATLEGEVLEPSGMVFGGSDKGVLKIKRQIKEIEEEAASKREKINELVRLVAAIKEEIVSTENNMISIDGEISSQEKFHHELGIRISNQKEESARLSKKQEFISLEITDDNREMEALESAREEKKQKGSVLEDEKQQIEESIRTVQASISEKKEARETMRSGLTEVKLELTSMREKMAATRREHDRLNASIADINRKQEDMLAERDNIQEGIGNKELAIVEKENALKLKISLLAELQGEASNVNDILEAKTAELALIEKRQKELASELDSIHTELSHVEMRKMEQTMKLNYMKEDIEKTYSIDIESAEIATVIEQDEEARLPEMKEKLTSMGSVSLGTIDEYEELKERYEFLTKQRDDLLESIEALEGTIRKINRTTQKRLQEAFEALNEKFKEVFMILFGKGRAELQMTEGSILEAGIEIVAQPPGKRLQNINLLSGGEKALTAISLLFAGFMIKPTPLCLLDEVDAPLDESNTDRFTNLLKELARNIQFITITHNRRSMEAADYMYGITMAEPGSSKVVSMHLAEAV